MSNELNNQENVVTEEVKAVTTEKKAKKNSGKPNFFVRAWKKLVKFFKDTTGEMKKVTWLSKGELVKSTKLVVITVTAVAAAILVIDTAFAFVINTVAGLIG